MRLYIGQRNRFLNGAPTIILRGVAVDEQVLEHNGRILSDDKSVAFYGVGSDEILLFHQEIDLEDQSHEDKRRKVQEYIRMQNVFDNFEKAIVFNPESFVPTAMLYIHCSVNGVPVKAFIDSGAQLTIMSKSCAERCGITQLMDQRFAGTAHGIGSARILGRIHSVDIKIGHSYLPSSFSIIDDDSMELIIGLDLLKKFKAQIDLKYNVLRIDGEVVPFTQEADDTSPPHNGIPSQINSMSGPTLMQTTKID
eukprot:TRINITY_DN6908_c0_g1_i1.p1 TRINITY_DN6908_c0_g1~~TRINITY_DN6908_c0_g1_i1.p1  ORF type:complete len:252 (-),score=60.24 TRINITY_DN6908_c0_g1_i1:119-874(-)